MSKRGYISRYMLVIKKLKVNPYCSYEDLNCYIENQVEYLQMQDDTLKIGFSKRTMQRDFREIRNIFGIDIEFSSSEKGYFISQSESENMNFQRMMESFDIFNSLNLSNDISPYIILEKRRPQGTENLYGLLHAIKNKLEIRFSYHKYWEEEMSKRHVQPFALKEFKNRWYVFAKDLKDNNSKTFALDRLTELEITSNKFEIPINLNVENIFKYSFGIIKEDRGEPDEIILAFDSFQGKYLKSLPLHESQIIIKDDENELVIKLKLFITFDLIQEILSFGETVKVLQPESLINEVKSSLEKSLLNYKSIKK